MFDARGNVDPLLANGRLHPYETRAILERNRFGEIFDRGIGQVREVFGELRNADDPLVDRHFQALFQEVAYVLREELYIWPGRDQQMHLARVAIHIFAHKCPEYRRELSQHRLSCLFGMDAFHRIPCAIAGLQRRCRRVIR